MCLIAPVLGHCLPFTFLLIYHCYRNGLFVPHIALAWMVHFIVTHPGPYIKHFKSFELRFAS